MRLNSSGTRKKTAFCISGCVHAFCFFGISNHFRGVRVGTASAENSFEKAGGGGQSRGSRKAANAQNDSGAKLRLS
jgi:hypothetical protein